MFTFNSSKEFKSSLQLILVRQTVQNIPVFFSKCTIVRVPNIQQVKNLRDKCSVYETESYTLVGDTTVKRQKNLLSVNIWMKVQLEKLA